MEIDGWTASESLISVAQASHFSWTPLEPQPCPQGSQLEQPVCVGCDVEANPCQPPCMSRVLLRLEHWNEPNKRFNTIQYGNCT